jgi:hypothetical protein
MMKIKMICDWTDSETLCKNLNYMESEMNFVSDHQDVNFYVVIDNPYNGELFMPNKTIVLRTNDQNDYKNENFLKMIRLNDEWSLQSENYIETDIILPGHPEPLTLKEEDSLFIYGSDQPIRNLKKMVENEGISIASEIKSSKYCLMPMTTKDHEWDPLSKDSLAFYWVVPNKNINPKTYILLNIHNLEESIKIIKTSILNNEYIKRINIIKQEKNKILNLIMTLKRTIENISQCDLNNEYHLMYHKYIYDIVHRQEQRILNKICFLHSCSINSNSLNILKQMLRCIFNSGLMQELDYLFIVNLGQPVTFNIGNTFRDKVIVINHSENVKLFEKPTLNLIWSFSQFHQNVKILYLHTKGVSYNENPSQINDWRNLMMYFLVEKYDTCLEMLDTYSNVGNNYKDEPHPHFSGNFWWTTSNYISTLQAITSDIRHDCEWWLLNDDPNVSKYTMHNDDVDHYLEDYPRSLYCK